MQVSRRTTRIRPRFNNMDVTLIIDDVQWLLGYLYSYKIQCYRTRGYWIPGELLVYVLHSILQDQRILDTRRTTCIRPRFNVTGLQNTRYQENYLNTSQIQYYRTRGYWIPRELLLYVVDSILQNQWILVTRRTTCIRLRFNIIEPEDTG